MINSMGTLEYSYFNITVRQIMEKENNLFTKMQLFYDPVTFEILLTQDGAAVKDKI